MKIDEAIERYKPKSIKYLFITEASPVAESFRHFYYAYAEGRDDLFLNMMQALFPITYKSYLPTKELRKSKKTFLEMFRDKGCFIIDSVPEAFSKDVTRSARINAIRDRRENLLAKIRELSDENTKVILICATVYAACNDYLVENNVNVVNNGSVSFPDRWHKENFHVQMKQLLARIDWDNMSSRKPDGVKIIKKT